MALPPMSPGGQWFQVSTSVPPVYVPAKQLEAHGKRMQSEGWYAIPDPRREEDYQQSPTPTVPSEATLQARIDQLEALVQQLVSANTAPVQEEQPASPDDSVKPKKR